MTSTGRTMDIISGVIGLSLVSIFVFGLAWSISIGFAGFWKGLPFWVITITVVSLAVFDLWKAVRSRLH